jgi:DNA-binding NarL/FixJ family response regulator
MTEATVPRTGKAGILVVDDHPIVREGLARFINQEPDMFVCGEAEAVDDAIKQIDAKPPDLAIVDISLKGISGIELIKRIHARLPGLPILVLSMHEESLYAERALRAGAKGYLMKHEATESVVDAIRQILFHGKDFHVSEKMVARILRNLVRQPDAAASPVEQLSDRELEVFQLIGQGRGTREIAKELHLSVKTVETHRAHIKQKLNLKHANELVHFASQWVQTQNQG